VSTPTHTFMSDAPTQYGLPQRVLTLLDGVLSAHPEVEAAILFGSRANGSFRPESDVDLALVGHCPPASLARITFELNELPTPYTFDVLAYEQVTHPELRAHIQRAGIQLYSAPQRGTP
jgi:uncharacterized protein